MLGYEPNDRIEYVKNPNFWKTGFPYMNSMQLKILGDEQARVAALKAGAIDGATLSVDVARSLANDSNLTVLKGPNAAFRELQMTIKRGEDKPWHKQGVRLAVITRSTARTSSSGSTAARPSTRGMFRPATAPGRCRTRICGRSTRSSTCRWRRS